MSERTELASGHITNHEEVNVILIEPSDGTPALVRGALAATPHNSHGNPLLCCGGDDRQDYRESATALARHKAGGL
jgi:acyl-CoA synthetase (NDP forming)